MNILSNKIILSSSLFCSVYLFSSSLKKIIEAHQMNNLLSKNEIDRMFELTNTNYHNNIITFNGIVLVISGSVITFISMQNIHNIIF